jgi:hypothetical protein
MAALPYFLAMASDLHRCGYKRTDVLRIYGFNLILLPVNLAGVFKSLQQAMTGKKIPFARTPKVSNRTATPALFALSPFLIIGYSIFTFVRDYHAHNWGNATFAAVNTLAASYAVISFMGLRNSLVDMCLGVIERLYVTDAPKQVQVVRPRRAPAVRHEEQDWQDVLYHGAAATDTGRYREGEAGFKILAQPPKAPPKHDRRAGDRMPAVTPGAVQHNRRAGDRREGSGQLFDRRADDRAGDRSADGGQSVDRRADERRADDRRADDRARPVT